MGPNPHPMNRLLCASMILSTLVLLGVNRGVAQNPLILDQFTADPTARVFEGKIYVYPSHDINEPGKGRPNWFVMEDYHVFSSENLVDWTDHGVIMDESASGCWTNHQSLFEYKGQWYLF